MSLFNKKTIMNRLIKVGLIVDENQTVTRGTYRLRIRDNGNSGTCFIAIDNLEDPSRGEYDHYTTYFPTTIKAAINWMLRS